MGMQHLIRAATAAGYAAVSHDLTPWDDVDDQPFNQRLRPAAAPPDDPLPRSRSTALVAVKSVWSGEPRKLGTALAWSASMVAMARTWSGSLSRAPAGA
jgi:hypothetical protein